MKPIGNKTMSDLKKIEITVVPDEPTDAAGGRKRNDQPARI